jgi:hypothetical protein
MSKKNLEHLNSYELENELNKLYSDNINEADRDSFFYENEVYIKKLIKLAEIEENQD